MKAAPAASAEALRPIPSMILPEIDFDGLGGSRHRRTHSMYRIGGAIYLAKPVVPLHLAQCEKLGSSPLQSLAPELG